MDNISDNINEIIINNSEEEDDDDSEEEDDDYSEEEDDDDSEEEDDDESEGKNGEIENYTIIMNDIYDTFTYNNNRIEYNYINNYIIPINTFVNIFNNNENININEEKNGEENINDEYIENIINNNDIEEENVILEDSENTIIDDEYGINDEDSINDDDFINDDNNEILLNNDINVNNIININNIFNNIIGNGYNANEVNNDEIYNMFNNIDPLTSVGLVLLNNSINIERLNINNNMAYVEECLDYCDEENMLNNINFEYLNIIHGFFLEFYEMFKIYSINKNDLIKKTIMKAYKILLRTHGFDIKDITLNIMTYAKYSENFVIIGDEEYNNNLFYNCYLLIVDNVRQNLLTILIAREFENILNNAYENNQNMVDVKSVLSNDTLSLLPIITYNELDEELKSINNHCTVCRDMYAEIPYKDLRILKCSHVFCCECIDPWLLTHSHKCPNCRQEMDGHIHI